MCLDVVSKQPLVSLRRLIGVSKRSAHECKYGGPGSTMNFWELSAFTDRLTLGVKMHSTAAFLSMPNEDGIIMGGKKFRRFNDNTMRGYPLWLPLTTGQVSDVVVLDEDILRAKGGRHVPDNSHEILDPEENREAVRRACALRYLDGYPDTKVMPLSIEHIANTHHTRDSAKPTIRQGIP